MRLLALAGERSAALAQYESCRRILAAELGIEPAAWDAFVGRQMRTYAAAREQAGLALQIAGEIGDPRVRGHGLALLGHALAGQSLWAEAAAAYRQAQALWDELGARLPQWEVQAGLAHVALAAKRRVNGWVEPPGPEDADFVELPVPPSCLD